MTRNTPHKLYGDNYLDEDGLQKVVSHMRRFSRAGSADPDVIGLVRQECANLQQGDYNGEILACYYWCCRNIRYMKDPLGVELVQSPGRTLKERAGDCDDIATLLAAMLLACGNRCRFALVGLDGASRPGHVYVEVQTPSGWNTLDPVANKETGEMLGRITVKGEVPL